MEKITDETIVKWLKNYKTAILKLSQRLDELTGDGFDPTSPEIKALIQKLQKYDSKFGQIGETAASMEAVKKLLELAQKQAQDAEDLANVAASAAEDADDLANTAKDAAQRALNGDSEWGQSVTESIGNLTEENGVLSGKVTELTKTADGLSTKVASFEGEMEQLTGDGGTIDSLEGSISSLEQTASGFETRVTAVENGVSTNASSIQQLSDELTLKVVDTNGAVLTQIKMDSEHNITLTGDVIADALTVAKLFAKDITATGNFQVKNGTWGIVLNDNTLKIGIGLEEGVVNSADISFEPSNIYLSAGGTHGTIHLQGNSGVHVSGGIYVNESKLIPHTEGTSGNWKYRKWESGFKEAWYRGPLTTSIDADGGGGIYFKSGLSVDYPFAYDTVPMVNISVTAPGVMVWPVVAAETDTSSVYFYLLSNSYSASQTYYVNLYIAG